MRTDADLATAFRGGDDQAYAILYGRYKRPLFLFAVRMLGDREAAGDIVQDSFLRAYERREQLNDPESFRSWLFAIARNRCLSHLRRRRGRASIEEVPEEVVATGPGADARETEQDVSMVRRALGELKVDYREVLILREYQDLSYREIARIIEATESAVKSRLFKARKALHDLLKPAFAGRDA
jgi:RNA polymerase sigma-70 factor (ECF subfamily)